MDVETSRQFYIVFSSRTLESIGNLIESYYEKVIDKDPNVKLKDFCLMVPDKFRQQATMRTIVVIDEKVFTLLKEDESDIDAFKIEKLQLKKHFYPNTEHHETANLYIILPQFLDLTACQDHLIERMTALRNYGVWTKSDYTIHVPKIDRIGSSHNGVAFIYFNKLQESRLDDIILTRLFINNTKWPKTNHEVHCYWSKTKEGRDLEFKKRANEKLMNSDSDGTNDTDGTDDNDGTIIKNGNDNGNKDGKKNPWIEKKGKHK